MLKENNIFTVDIEDTIYTDDCPQEYYYSNYHENKSKLIHNTKKLLQILKSNNSTATFFVLGKLAEDIPDLIKEIYDSGNEIANHGYSHISLNLLSPDTFKLDLERSHNAIYKTGISEIIGYRAPYFSINSSNMWAIDIIRNMGYVYDSSIQPFGFHPSYGINNSKTTIYKFNNELIEIPLTVAKVCGINLPCSGGAYFRFYPYKLFSYMFIKSNLQNNYSIFYIHPWELCENVTQNQYSSFANFRKFYNSEFTFIKLEKLFSEFQFTSVKNYLKKQV